MSYPYPEFTLLPYQSRMIDARQGLLVEVTAGCLWLTRPGDLSDHFLQAGTSMALQEDRVLLQGEQPAKAGHAGVSRYRISPLPSRQDLASPIQRLEPSVRPRKSPSRLPRLPGSLLAP